MNMDRADELDRKLVGGVGERGRGEQRLRNEIAVRRQLVDDQLVLPLDRHVYPWLRRVDVEVARTEAVAAIGGDLAPAREHAVLEGVDVQRARVFGLRP